MLRSTVVSTCALTLALAGCASHSGTKPPKPPRHPIEIALAPVGDSRVEGKLEVVVVPDGVRIQGTITGLAPGSTHGFHIHQHGDCSSSDASSAGGHFNPTATEHGDPVALVHHAGDIANQLADAQGRIDVDQTVHGVSLDTGTNDDVLGRAVVLQDGPDDYVTQPSGGSSAAIACGVILKKDKE
ncbi:MAG TPA: superoxide dismutase family protein [Xanthomonadaceae bacterium]|jgi:Cu-Zn family superoxide dismutase|nr:superoxide dismutase family protein [Xanthomonadaceae bacterium]